MEEQWIRDQDVRSPRIPGTSLEAVQGDGKK